MTESTASPSLGVAAASGPHRHPLLTDRARLERIADNMSAQIQRTMAWGGGPPSRALAGGESADDVLQESLLALLAYDEAQLRTSWEALSAGIARHKAMAALRRATRGRRSPSAAGGDPDAISIVPLDDVADGEMAGRGPSDPERAFLETEEQLALLKLAHDRLSQRDQAVFLAVHFEGLTRESLAHQLGLTPQGVGKIYVRVAKQLLAELSAATGTHEGG